jgi:hypothetical protein
VTRPTGASPASEDERLRRLHRRLDEVIGPGHASTLMTCLRPGGWRLVTAEEWGGLHERMCEVIGKEAADTMFASLWQIVYDGARRPA